MHAHNLPPVVVFDIDSIIFQSPFFKENLCIFLEEKIQPKQRKKFEKSFKAAEEKTIKTGGYFSPHTFLENLISIASLSYSLSELEKIFFDEMLFIESFYMFAKDVFEELTTTHDIPVDVFYASNKKLHEEKLRAIQETFHDASLHLTASEGKNLKEFLQEYTQNHVYLVDDSPTLLQDVKKIMPEVTTILLRAKSISDEEKKNQDYIIENLSQLTSLLKRENILN